MRLHLGKGEYRQVRNNFSQAGRLLGKDSCPVDYMEGKSCSTSHAHTAFLQQQQQQKAMDVEKTSKIWRNPWRTENSELRIFVHLESTEAESQVPYSVYSKTVAQGNSEKTSVTFNLE